MILQDETNDDKVQVMEEDDIEEELDGVSVDSEQVKK